MAAAHTNIGFFNPIMVGFMAGFMSALTFHQVSLWVLWLAGLAHAGPYATALVPPFGIPAFLSLAFWGGVWGVLLALIHGRFPRNGYWMATFLFGAILPSLVALFIVLPLKGLPMGAGWRLPVLTTVFIINGMWGLGTGVFLRLLQSGCRAAGWCVMDTAGAAR